MIFKRKLHKVVDSELYAAERHLLAAQAARETARAQLSIAEATVAAFETRVTRLLGEQKLRQALREAEKQP